MANETWKVIGDGIQQALAMIPEQEDAINYLREIGEDTTAAQSKLVIMKQKIRKHVDALKKRGIIIDTGNVKL